jgi:Domain of unknown function (DUF929)
MVVQSEPSGPQSPTGGSSRPVPVGLLTVGVILLVLVIVLVLVVVELTNSSPAGRVPLAVQKAPAGLVQAVTTIPASVFNLVGDPSEPVITDPPTIVHHARTLTTGGLAAVVWVGALFCPACAAERWALVIALGRFGTFDTLYTTTSAASDPFPDTATFSLEGAEYNSRTVALSAVEEYGNSPSNRSPVGFTPLGHLNALEAQAMETYDRAPWATPGLLPFVDVGDRVIISGESFSPEVLSGLTMQQIATDLTVPSSPVAQALLGTANQITAAICLTTRGKPANVCSTQAVAQTARLLGLGS